MYNDSLRETNGDVTEIKVENSFKEQPVVWRIDKNLEESLLSVRISIIFIVEIGRAHV